jgi:hypothetical protein
VTKGAAKADARSLGSQQQLNRMREQRWLREELKTAGRAQWQGRREKADNNLLRQMGSCKTHRRLWR